MIGLVCGEVAKRTSHKPRPQGAYPLGGKANHKLITSRLTENQGMDGPKQEARGGMPGIVWSVRGSVVSWVTPS